MCALASLSNKPQLMLGKLVYDIPQAQWKSYESVIKQVLNEHVRLHGGPYPREEAYNPPSMTTPPSAHRRTYRAPPTPSSPSSYVYRISDCAVTENMKTLTIAVHEHRDSGKSVRLYRIPSLQTSGWLRDLERAWLDLVMVAPARISSTTFKTKASPYAGAADLRGFSCLGASLPKWTLHAQERTNNQDVLDVGTGHKMREGTREDRMYEEPGARGLRKKRHAHRLRWLLYIVALPRVYENWTVYSYLPEIEHICLQVYPPA
ncbi:hypothetical protein OH76DRAFT_1484234 [Lentinus brumalis]|uniref:Uncharacterized protein n=1 Tax=Lentinus brumalis TaxID=2498619 RepID=A0A371D6A3_9APHY|nr:hypothetical protein OH76DRAFT_1484234 [Polyporus brumalis]